MTGPTAPNGGPSAGRVLAVIGTRPEAIKLAPVVRALRGMAPGIETRVALSGQHRELADAALAGFALDPDWELGIMGPDQSLYEIGHGCLDALRRVAGEWRPDLILVQGDTATVFFGALVGYFEGIAVGHVEAGLRTDDLRRPFPEEGFRRLVSVIAELHFAPTERARDNLLREGVPAGRIHLTGNTVVDALLQIVKGDEPAADPTLRRLLGEGGGGGKGAAEGAPWILLTAHRRESHGAPLERIFRGVRELVEAHPRLEVLFPVHPSPRVREPARRLLGGHPRIHLGEPLAYRDLALALKGAALVLTDSGGIQEEAPTFGTPVLVLRDVTERPEGVEAGVARLVGTDQELLVREASKALAARTEPGARSGEDAPRPNPYGDGRAAERIAAAVRDHLRGRPGAGG